MWLLNKINQQICAHHVHAREARVHVTCARHPLANAEMPLLIIEAFELAMDQS